MFNIRSKTHMFGALLGIFGGLASFLPMARDMISPDLYGILFIGASVITIVLRNITTKPIGER